MSSGNELYLDKYLLLQEGLLILMKIKSVSICHQMCLIFSFSILQQKCLRHIPVCTTLAKCHRDSCFHPDRENFLPYTPLLHSIFIHTLDLDITMSHTGRKKKKARKMCHQTDGMPFNSFNVLMIFIQYFFKKKKKNLHREWGLGLQKSFPTDSKISS